MRVLWTARRSNQSVLKEIYPEYSLEGLMLGKTEGEERRGWQRKRWLDSITDSMDTNLRKFQEMVKHRKAWHAGFHALSAPGNHHSVFCLYKSHYSRNLI